MRPTIRRPFIISIMLMVFKQFSGINSVVAYVSHMLRDAGFSDPNLAVIAIAAVQLAGTATSGLIVDKVGRRLLLMLPTSAMCVSMLVLGASRYFLNFPTSVTLISFCCYLIGFAIGLGPVPWLIMSEIFPTEVRGVASGIAILVNWLAAFTVIRLYVKMENSMHPYGCYWFYAAVCLVFVVYVFVFLPETKRKTLEEMEKLFVKHSDIQTSDSFECGGISS